MKKILRNLKKRFYKWRALKSICTYRAPLYINYPCIFNSNTYLGTNTSFNGMQVEGSGRVEIGDNFHSGKDCVMYTSIHDYEGKALPYDSTYIHKNIVIEDNVWLGSRVILLGGVKIGEGSIIQAGAVVVNDIPKFSIAGGNPAKTFKQRNIEHYLALKEKKAFH